MVLVGAGTTSDVAGGAGCVEQTLAADELLLKHPAGIKGIRACTEKSPRTCKALVKVVVLPLSSTGITTSCSWQHELDNIAQPCRVHPGADSVPRHRPWQDPRCRQPRPGPAWPQPRSAAARRRLWSLLAPADAQCCGVAFFHGHGQTLQMARSLFCGCASASSQTLQGRIRGRRGLPAGLDTLGKSRKQCSKRSTVLQQKHAPSLNAVRDKSTMQTNQGDAGHLKVCWDAKCSLNKFFHHVLPLEVGERADAHDACQLSFWVRAQLARPQLQLKLMVLASLCFGDS